MDHISDLHRTSTSNNWYPTTGIVVPVRAYHTSDTAI